jgi:hypothetical protein
MHPSTTWAGVDAAKLFESFAAVIAALNPTTLIWSIVLVIVIAVAVILTMKMFLIQTPARRRDIIKLVEALRRRSPKP